MLQGPMVGSVLTTTTSAQRRPSEVGQGKNAQIRLNQAFGVWLEGPKRKMKGSGTCVTQGNRGGRAPRKHAYKYDSWARHSPCNVRAWNKTTSKQHSRLDSAQPFSRRPHITPRSKQGPWTTWRRLKTQPRHLNVSNECGQAAVHEEAQAEGSATRALHAAHGIWHVA